MDEKEKFGAPEEEIAPESVESTVNGEVAEAEGEVSEVEDEVAEVEDGAIEVAEIAEVAEAESIADAADADADSAADAAGIAAAGASEAVRTAKLRREDVTKRGRHEKKDGKHERKDGDHEKKAAEVGKAAEDERSADGAADAKDADKPKWKKIAGTLLSLVPPFLCLVLISVSTHMNGLALEGMTEQTRDIITVSMILLAVSSVLGVLRPRIPKAIGWVFWAIAPAGIMLLCEWILRDPFGVDANGNPVFSTALIIFNIVIYYIAAGFFLFATRNTFVSAVAASAFPLLLATANYYVHMFRGTVLFPWDLKSIGVAMTVVDNYEFDFPVVLAFVIECFIVIWQLMYFSRVKILRSFKKMLVSIGCAVICLAMGIAYVNYVQSDHFETFFSKSSHSKEMQKYFNPTFYPYLFTPNAVYNHDGMMVSVIYALKFMNVEKPDGYAPDKVAALAEKYADAADPEPAGVKPNIIVIMNEAWSDVSVDAPFETNLEVFPVTSRMKDDVVRGQMYMSVLGGNTANSEYEFLTSSSMAFMPPGSVPYQTVIKQDTPTLVTALEEQGYQSVAMHPYNAPGWDRNKVYPFFGFDEMYFKDSFKKGVERIRSYISDSAMYEKIEELYEARNKDKPFFLFGVTMQNHGGYTAAGLDADVFVKGLESDKRLSQYLSLIRISDFAFGEIVDYFSNVDEPTIILMFGDHQPGEIVTKPLYKNAKLALPSTFAEEQTRYKVPFIMWANYDIEEKTDILTSPNYLSILLCETAGLRLTPYQKYLRDLQKDYPVITANLFIDAAGKIHKQDEIKSVDALVEYQTVAYNQVIDYKNRAEKMFTTVK